MELPLGMVSKHAFWYLCMPDYMWCVCNPQLSVRSDKVLIIWRRVSRLSELKSAYDQRRALISFHFLQFLTRLAV